MISRGILPLSMLDLPCYHFKAHLKLSPALLILEIMFVDGGTLSNGA